MQQHVSTVLGRALHTLTHRLKAELVLLPSATHPGTLFCAVSTPEIRERNLEQWRRSGRRGFVASKVDNVAYRVLSTRRMAA